MIVISIVFMHIKCHYFQCFRDSFEFVLFLLYLCLHANCAKTFLSNENVSCFDFILIQFNLKSLEIPFGSITLMFGSVNCEPWNTQHKNSIQMLNFELILNKMHNSIESIAFYTSSKWHLCGFQLAYCWFCLRQFW